MLYYWNGFCFVINDVDFCIFLVIMGSKGKGGVCNLFFIFEEDEGSNRKKRFV